jgi:enoyl-CoA hydratase
VALITLARPQAMNALNRALRRALTDGLTRLAQDDRCIAIVLTGAGRAFCAGLDLREVAREPGLLAAIPELDPVAALGRCPQPVIAYVNGPAVTGGFELALACDIRIAGPDARFADTHAFVGAFPGWGLSQRLSRIVGLGRAMELSLSGRFIGPQEAVAWGLVNRIAKDGLSEALVLAGQIVAAVPGMPEALKRMIIHGYQLPFGDALAWEAAEAERLNATVTGDALEERRAGVVASGSAAVRGGVDA